MQIRLRTDADIDACVAVMRQTHEVDRYPVYGANVTAEFLVARRRELQAWVAELDGQIVGHVSLHRAEDDATLPPAQAASSRPAAGLAFLSRLLVSPDARRLGLARRLVQTAVDHAHAGDLRPVLEVVTDASGAIALYESLSWKRIGALALPIPGHPPLDVYLYLAPDAD